MKVFLRNLERKTTSENDRKLSLELQGTLNLGENLPKIRGLENHSLKIETACIFGKKSCEGIFDVYYPILLFTIVQMWKIDVSENLSRFFTPSDYFI